MITARDGGVWVELAASDVRLLEPIPEWLSDVGTDPDDLAGPRLNQTAYPDDPIASAEYEVGGSLNETRSADRVTFSTTLRKASGGVQLSEDEAAAWMRVVGDVRIALAARMEIDDDAWERSAGADPRMRLLHYLTAIQTGLIEALDDLMA